MSEPGPLVLFERYRLDRVLGEGGQAVVLAVFDLRLEVERALKMMLPRLARKRVQRERFVAEAELLARIEHPNVVRVYDVSVAPPAPYFVAELITGGSLADRLQRGPLPPRMVVDVLCQVCAGLEAAHGAGVVHRDVKPHNVLLTPSGGCKVVDFGIARHEDSAHTKAGVTMGTEGFMPPEQFTDAASVDVRADVYGVGMTAFVLLTRRDPVEWLGGERRGVPEALVSVLEAATAQDRELRPPTTAALAQQLREAAAALPDDPPGLPLVVGRSGSSDPALARRLADVAAWVTAEPSSEEGSASLAGSTPSLRPTAGYSMSRPRADAAHRPQYLSEPPPAPPSGFEVKLDHEELQATLEARSRRGESPDPGFLPPPPPPEPEAEAPPEPAPEPAPAPAEAAASHEGDHAADHRALWLAVAVTALAIALAVAVGGWAMRERSEAQHHVVVGEARSALVDSVDENLAVCGALEQLGSDPTELAGLLQAFERARGDEARARAAAALVDRLRSEAERLAEPGSAARASLDLQTAPMVEAAARWRQVER
jgi:serine/threonine protein kinase